MRKPRDYKTELKALGDKTRLLKERKVQQLGEPVIAADADALDAHLLAGVLLQAAQTKDTTVTEGWCRRWAGWFQRKRGAAKKLERNRKALFRSFAARHRIEAVKARTDRWEWVVTRRGRTRHLIELGGLVQKAGLVELTSDDGAVLLGAFRRVARTLRGENRGDALALWRRRGKGVFETGAEHDNATVI